MNDNNNSDADKNKIVEKAIRLERTYPDDLQSYFVSDMVIQHTSEHFTLSFFEIWPPPIIADTPQEREVLLEAIEKIEAKCVTRLVVTPEKMREFVKTMSENLEKYDKMMKVFRALKEGENKDE